MFRSCGIDREAGDVEWSVVDRWGTHPGLVEAFAQLIQTTLNERWPNPVERQSAVILFSAHSLPMTVVNRGDPYVAEVAGTVSAVMQRLAIMAANTEGEPHYLHPESVVDGCNR